MENISKYNLFITILSGKLSPNFSLELRTVNENTIVTESNIKFELLQGKDIEFTVHFHPKFHGKFIATATMFLDKLMTIPYSNLTFYGKRMTAAMIPCTHQVIFPPCYVGSIITRDITIELEAVSDLDSISCLIKDEANVTATVIDYLFKTENEETHTVFTVRIVVNTEIPFTGKVKVSFYRDIEFGCEVNVHYCVTYCPITLHAVSMTNIERNPYPYYPLPSEVELYEYLEKCCTFIEKWMFQQGFRRDLYPIIPDTFHATSAALVGVGKPSKGLNVSYLNFIRRIAGPLMKHIQKLPVDDEEPFKSVREIHDTYKQIIHLLQSRGANIWMMHAQYLLSYEQFGIYHKYVTPASSADFEYANMLLSDIDLFNRLNKQCWLDFILQSFKVFVMDSCFFECVCVSNHPRDIIKTLVDWYNEHIILMSSTLKLESKPVKQITNITTDLTDGIALASVIISHCPFLLQLFSGFCEIIDDGDIINNACLIIEAMNQLRLYFPLASEDFIDPNFLQMLFLSIHLFVVLPMFKPKETIVLSPPLLRSSTRHVSISPTSQESLTFTYLVLNNNHNSFTVDKDISAENGKKMSISVKYVANFLQEEKCLLLMHGYNKTRIFDTYIVFLLHGHVSALNPERKCKVIGPLYKPTKVEIQVASPFFVGGLFKIYITDIEPSIPVQLDETDKPRFYSRRLNLLEKEIYLNAAPKDAAEVQEQKVYLILICLSTQIGNSWIWFKSDIGEFFVRVTTQPRWDYVLDTLEAKVDDWPLEPCTCGESCSCFRTTVVHIHHNNELMLRGLRFALAENASAIMMDFFDQFIDNTTGKLIIAMLLEEGGCHMSEFQHILRNSIKYHVTSKVLIPGLEQVTLYPHSDAILTLPITIPCNENNAVKNFTINFISECGMDIRTYKIVIEPEVQPEISETCES